MKTQNVRLKTSDDFEIAGTYSAGYLPFGVVLLHMMPATRTSYTDYAERLSTIGVRTLAIDLRGHGDSSGGDYREFTHEQHQKCIFDVLAAVNYLKQQNPEMEIGFIGASIGANLALQYAAANPTGFVVALSPGLNYRGIETGRMVAALPENMPVYFASALDDARVEGNALQTETLYNACSSTKKTIQIFKTGGHGTELLNGNEEFCKSLLEWIKEAITINANNKNLVE